MTDLTNRSVPVREKDIRRGLPSASSFSITYHCPGSENLIRSMPVSADPETDNDDAARGSRLHKSWETDDTSELDEEDLGIYTAGVQYKERAVAQWCQDNNITEFKEGPRELRLWLHDPATLRPVTSGMMDWHFIADGHLIVGDYKSLWCRTLTPAHKNWQLRTLVTLLSKEYDGIKSIRAVLVKPIAKGDRTDSVDYSMADIEYAERDIMHSLWKSRQTDAQRIPGNHCTWCRAKSVCCEAMAWALLPSVIASNSTYKAPEALNVNLAKPSELVARMSLADCSMLQSRSSVIGKILDEVKKRLKKLPEDQLEGLGYRLVDGRKTDTITKPAECLAEIKLLGLSDEKLWQAVKINKGETVGMLMLELGWNSKQCDGYFQQLVSKFGETKQSDKMLEAI